MKTVDPNQDNVQIFTELYYEINEFMKTFGSLLNTHLTGARRQRPFCRMSVCEIMTVLIGFQIIGGQNFRQYYKDTVLQFHRAEFPSLVSYNRFTEAAERGKTSAGRFYGFKLHLAVNRIGELMSVRITAGNTGDRKPVMDTVKNLKGKLFGDKGYISAALAEDLIQQGLNFITALRKNMKKKDIPFADRILLRKRAVAETVNDLLKNFFQIEHSRHRSVFGFTANLFSALIAYSFYPKKPHMRGIDLQNALITV